MSPPHDMSGDERRELFALFGGEDTNGTAVAPVDVSAARAKVEAAVREAHEAQRRDDAALRQQVRDAERERDEAREALAAEKRAHRITTGQLENVIDAAADGTWMARALGAEQVRDEALNAAVSVLRARRLALAWSLEEATAAIESLLAERRRMSGHRFLVMSLTALEDGTWLGDRSEAIAAYAQALVAEEAARVKADEDQECARLYGCEGR